MARNTSGKHIYFNGPAGSELTIPLDSATPGGSFEIGTIIMIVNESPGDLLISAIGTLWLNGSASIGPRYVPTKTVASIMKVNADAWYITGPGVY
jgi:hypothetical protein